MNLNKIVAVMLVIAFTVLGVANISHTQNKLHLKNIELKSKAVQLKSLELKYDSLQVELNKADKNNKEQIDKLQQEKQQLEQERVKLQQELSVKQQTKLQLAAQSASKAITGTQTAYAASVPQTGAKAFIYSHESGNNPGSINASSGACGLGQAWPCSKLPCSLSDYACQDNFFTNYMLQRYGSWEAARSFWIANNYW